MLATAIARKPIRISVDTVQLYTALVEQAILYPQFQGIPITIPPGASVQVQVPSPSGQYQFAVEFRLAVSADHSLAYEISIDNGKYTFSDVDVVQANYASPVNFFSLGAIVPVKRIFQITLTNTGMSTLNINYVLASGTIIGDVWDTIEAAFFGSVTDILVSGPGH